MSDFEINVKADLDTSAAEEKLNALTKEQRKIKLDVEVNQDSAKKLTSNIEKGLSSTKLDTSSIANQLANSFNISDSKTINKLKSQMNNMVSSLAKTWNGKDFDFSKATGFYAGLNGLESTVTKNAKAIKSSSGIYDNFFNYFKDKKIYVSDELKNALGGDAYKELLQNNVGKIVRDATKGVSIDSIWGEMSNLFPEHFSADITNQADQIVRAFDLMKQARADMTQSFSVNELKGSEFTAMSDAIAQEVISAAIKMKDALQTNIMSATEANKSTIQLDVEVNAEKIASDIRSAIQNAGTESGEAINVDIKLNEEEIVSKLRSSISQLSTGDEPVKVDLKINEESLKSNLTAALTDVDIPVNFKVDAEEIESQIRSAIENIKDVNIDVHVNTDTLRESVGSALDTTTQTEQEISVPNIDKSGLTYMQDALNNVNATGQRSQGIFSSLGSSFREAFSAYSLANLMQDGLYKITDAGKEALSTVKEFNDLETDLSMATGESRSYARELMQSYNDLGQELGSVTSDVAKSADSWLRQGRSMADTNQLIKDSMVLSKDAQMSSEDASEVLTATLNGFQMSADQASKVNDILTSIDLESASDAGGIGSALTKVASQANNAGVSLEKTAAMIATVKDVTQANDETIGNAMKSILARMNNIKAGKFVDDNGEALNDVEKVLNKIGISMRDNNDQFLDSETILDTVADKWETFDKKTQNAVSTALGGTYQANSITAMLDNWDKVERLTEVAYNSEGTAQKKFEDNYLTSLEAKTNALKASLENLATTTVSSDLYSEFLDGSKAVADFAANTNLLQSALAGLGTAGGVYAFKQLIDMFKEFSDFSKALDLSKISDMSENSFSNLMNLSKGLSEAQTKLLLSSSALSEAQRTAILMSQGMGKAEAQAAVAAMGLTTANEAVAASTFSLSGAMEGMLATLIANPYVLIASALTAGMTVYSAYKRSVEEAVSSAKSAGNTWEENTTSIQDNISRIQELRTALASGTLTEQEAADAKSELLSIQESLSESYGNQVSGIDLINGSLTEQIALLDQVNEKQSQNFLNENKKGIDKAQKEMEKNRHTYLGRFYDNGSEESEAIKKSIKNLQETYGEDVFKLDSSDGITMDIQFNADASTAKDALNDFMTEVSGIEDQFGETDVTEQLANNAASGLTKAKDVLSEYQDIYKQAQEAELLSDDKLYKSGDTEQKASKWISDYAKAVEDYNNAIADGDNSKISEASQKFSELDSTVNDLVKNTGMSSYADQVKEVRDELNDTAIANDKFTKAVNGTDTSKFGKSISENAKALKELNLSDTDFRYAFETDGVQEGEDQINALVQAALDAGVISDTSASSVANLASMLAELGVISSSTGSSLDEAADSIGDISERIDKASAALTGIQKAESVLDAQSTGKSISLDDFNSDELADYTSALEYNNGALQLNAEKVRELQKAKAEEQIQTNNSQKAEKQNQYMQNIAQIEQLQEQLRGLSDAKGEEAQAIQASIDALLSDNDAIVNQCNQLDLLSASLREATGAYQNWLDKQNASESGDMFDDAMGAMEKIDNVTKNSDSEDYGRIGTNSYKAAVDFIVPDSVDSEDAEAVSSYMSSIEHYFNHDEDGNRIGLDVQEFCAKATKAGLMELDEASGEYKVAGQKTMEDFAEGLNLSLPMVQSMFGEMEEFGGEFDWADEATKTLGDMAVAAGEAKGRIEEMSGDTDMNIQIDVSDIDNTEDKVKTLDNTISQMQDYRATLDVDSSQVDDANAVIQYCVTQKQMLEAPAVMSVDTSQVDGELGNALSLLQQFQEAQNSVELQASVGADTSEAQGKVDSLVGEIQGLSPEIQAQLSIDTTSADTITASLQALSPEIMVKAGVDSSAVDAYAAEEKQSSGKVTWDNETGAVDAFASQVHRSSGIVSWGNDTSRIQTHFTATGTVNWTNTTPPTKGAGGANGTAHASGTAHYNHLVGHAYANGNWGTKTGGTTLVGELGREIVVDPGSGTWHTVGDNGAEFVNIPAGSIVFNHLQSEALLERGFVNGRGTARANGTAMVRGGISAKQASVASKHTTYSGSSSKSTSNSNTAPTAQSYNNNTSAVDDNTSATKDNTKAAKHSSTVFEWVERSIKKFKNAVENISNKINDYVTSAFKTSLLKQQISALQQEINANKRGQKTYMDKANSIANGYTYYYTPEGSDTEQTMNIVIPDSYKQAVQGGYWNIEDMDTTSDFGKGLAEAIQKYQDYYDKATECSQAVQELYNEQLKVFEQWANMPTEEAEKKLDKLTNKLNGIKSASTAVSTGGSGLQSLISQIKSDTGLGTAERKLASAKKAQSSAKKKASTANKNYATATKEANSAKSTMTSRGKSVISIAKKANVSSKKRKEIQASVKNGKAINTKGLTGNTLKAAKQYNSSRKVYNQDVKEQTAAKKKKVSANKAYSTANKNVRTQQANVNKITNSLTSAQRKVLNNKDAKYAYVPQNAMLDQQTAEAKQENAVRQAALKKANKNVESYEKHISSRNNKRDALLQNKKLTKAQKAALKANKNIDTSKITDKKLKAQIESYNKANKTVKSEATKYRILKDAQSKAQSAADQSQAEYAAMRVTNEQEKFKNIQNYYDDKSSLYKGYTESHQKKYEKSETHGNYASSKKYTTQITDLNKERTIQAESAKKLQAQLNSSVKKGIIKKGSLEWIQLTAQINEAKNAVSDLDNEIEQAKQDQITTLYEEMFDRAIEKANQLKDKIGTINDLITDDMMIDKDTGNLTEMGMLSIALNSNQLDTELGNIQTYVKKRQQIIDDFANGSNKSKYGEKTYDEMMAENDSAMQNAIQSANNYRNSILKIITSQAQAVQDALFKQIDAYKKALKKKKEYYDYDKQLKKKNSEIELLDQQIAALEGVTDAESKAMKAKLEAQRKEKQDDLNDTVRDHVYDLQVNGLDDLKDQLSEDFEKWSNQLSSDLKKMSDAISSAISNSGMDYDDMQKAISKILEQFGLNPNDYFTSKDNTSIKNSDRMDSGYNSGHLQGYAKGTKHVGGVPRVVMTNENGREIIVTKKGILTPIEPSDGIIPNDMTETLMQMAMNYRNFDIPEIKMPDVQIINKENSEGGGNVYVHYDTLLTVQGDVTKDALPDLKTILKQASEYTQNDIRKNRRRFG